MLMRCGFTVFLALSLCATSATAQTFVAVDAPQPNTVARQPFMLAGWAVDFSATTNAGVAWVQAYAFPLDGTPGTFLGTLVTQPQRPDVAAYYGQQFLNSAWGMFVTGLKPGNYHLHLYPYSTVTNSYGPAAVVPVTIAAQPYMWIDTPTSGQYVIQPFNFGGWAVDIAASAGSGVDVIHLWAWPTSGAAPIFAGVAQRPFGNRPDVGAYFQNGQFTPSGFNISVSNLPPGSYNLVASAWSTVANGFNQAFSVPVNVDFTAATPSMSPAGGSFNAPVVVSLATTTAGATIRYTLDGSTPTAGSAVYGAPLSIASNASLRARTFLQGWIPSGVAAGDFSFFVSTPVISPPSGAYPAPFQISISTATPGAEIRYTSDGTPPTTTSSLYTGPLQQFGIGSAPFIRARAFRAGWPPSSEVSASYTVHQAVAAAPLSSPVAGTYDVGQIISLSTPEPSSIIRYTIDGSDPNDLSLLYSGPLTLAQPTTLKARTFKSGFAPSNILTAVFVTRVARPTISPAGGLYDTMPSVSISTTTSSASIRYTTNRTEPTEQSALYVGPFQAGVQMTVKAIAYRSGWAPSETAAQTYLASTAATEPATSPAVVGLSSVGEGGLNVVGSATTFGIAGATFGSYVAVYSNGTRVPGASLAVNSQQVQAFNAVGDGLNEIELEATDTDGLLIYRRARVWAGSTPLTFSIVNTSSVGIAGATVTAWLVDDNQIAMSGATNGGGQITFQRLPANHWLRVNVSAPGYRFWTFDALTSEGSRTVFLDLANNDFSQGLAGWTLSPLTHLDTHSEASTPFVACPSCIPRAPAPEMESGPNAVGAEELLGYSPAAATAQATDWDLIVSNRNSLVPQTASRRFFAAPGSAQVSVRYRFQSAEVLTGWYFPDWFQVTIRNARTGQQVTDSRNVQNLIGLFDPLGATGWFTLPMSVAQPGDPIDVSIAVGNGTDNAHESVLFVDLIQERTHQITNLQLRDLIHHNTATQTNDQYAAQRPDKALTYLSTSAMAATLVSYEGYVRIHGTVTVTGPPTDSLQRLWIEVLENGVLRATGELARDTVSTVRTTLLNRQFGAGGVSILEGPGGTTPVLFEIPANQLASINQTSQDPTVTIRLQIRAQFASGDALEPVLYHQRMTRLVQYTRTNRFGTRDAGDCQGLSATAQNLANRPPFPCGGDSWTRTRAKLFADRVTVVTHQGIDTNVNWNDFSNMNGGFFPIHAEHRDGRQIDGLFNGYIEMDEQAAYKMIDFLRRYGTQIDRLLVGYNTVAVGNRACARAVAVAPTDNSNPFWNVVRAAPALPNGIVPRDMITNAAGHCDHFDVRINLSRVPDLP